MFILFAINSPKYISIIIKLSDLEEFFSSTDNLFTLEPFLTWNRELRAKRSLEKDAVAENGRESSKSDSNAVS